MAERFNIGKMWPNADRLVERGEYERWLRLSIGIGAYGAGTTERTQIKSLGREKLLSLGLPEDFYALNLLPPAECGAWDAALARQIADELRILIVTAHNEYEAFELSDRVFHAWLFDRVVLVGKRVAHAMECDAPFFEPVGGMIVVPHPSGRNLLWNTLDVAEAQEKVQRWLND